MPRVEPTLVRGIAVDAWKDIWRRPLMWLILSASFLPMVFLINFLIPGFVILGSPTAFYLILFFVGYSICFAFYFLFWCMAVYLYNGQVRGKGGFSYRSAFSRMEGWAWPSFIAGLVCGLIAVLAFEIAQLVTNLVLSFLAAGQTSTGSQFALSLVGYYLTYLAADLIIVFIALVPQMLALEKGRKVEEVLRASYRVVKERYRDALLLFIVPEIVIRTIFIGALFIIAKAPGGGLIFTLLLLCMTVLEAGRIAFVAAAFNRFYYHVLEEEKKKRKAKTKKQPAKKQPAKKQTKKR